MNIPQPTAAQQAEQIRQKLNRVKEIREQVQQMKQLYQEHDALMGELLPLFIEEFNALARKRVKTVPGSVWGRLGTYDWPGNVRELRNVVERCVLLADGPAFPERWLHLGDGVSPSSGNGPAAGVEPAEPVGDRLCLPLDGAMTLDETERRILGEALSGNGDNLSLPARVLGTTREKLRYRVQKYGLKTSD